MTNWELQNYSWCEPQVIDKRAYISSRLFVLKTHFNIIEHSSQEPRITTSSISTNPSTVNIIFNTNSYGVACQTIILWKGLLSFTQFKE